ncbi:MAG: 50S ribosomal protein L20 [Gemmatimonadota bacterium]|jgi:large subunit ribosomal protein L20|nr:50S ribosomal protein L20 [Gemmatimonadota bacterium]HCP99263.1 50S ribosomal protein L20 [Candidatus Latescibacterota bacterium]
MPRATNAVASRRRRKKIIKLARGFWGRRNRLFRTAQEAVNRSLAYAYRDRRQRRRDFRRLWITRINAAARLNGLTYGKLIHGMKLANIEIDRKALAELAINDPTAFAAVAETVKSPSS